MTNETKDLLFAKDLHYVYEKKSGFFRSNRNIALKGISLYLKRGERLGIIGRNGSGKSTLLKILAGVLSPTRGLVSKNTNENVAICSLNYPLNGNISGRDNGLLNLMLQGANKQLALQQLKHVEEFCELGKFFDSAVRSYSAGMKAKLSFAIAMHTQSQILLLDEVLSVGDLDFREKAKKELHFRMSEKSVIFVSHNLGAVKQICSRVMLLKDGEIIAEGTPPEVMKAYRAQ